MKQLLPFFPMRLHPLLPALAVLLLLPSTAFAQLDRPPTDAEIDALLQAMRQDIPQLLETGIYSDRRSPEEREQIEALVAEWSVVDAAIAPFLGEWTAIEESLAIYPTGNAGEVCIIDTFLEESDFYLGRVVEDKIYTDINLILVLDSGFLVSTFVYEDQAGRYEYANPRSLVDPATSYFAEYYPHIPPQFQQAGCLINVPG
jgi:hypothetical protein